MRLFVFFNMLIAQCLFLLNQNDVRPNSTFAVCTCSDHLHKLSVVFSQSIPITRAIYCVLLIIIMFERFFFFLPRECHFVLADKTSHNSKIVHSILGSVVPSSQIITFNKHQKSIVTLFSYRKIRTILIISGKESVRKKIKTARKCLSELNINNAV